MKLEEEYNNERIVLICKSHTTEGLSEKECYRLEYLQKRLCVSIPRITYEDFEKVIELSDRIKTNTEELDRLLKELK